MQEKYKQKIKIKHADLPDLETPKKVSKAHCPSCEVELPVADLNIVDMVGKCHSCNTIFSIQDMINQLHPDGDELHTEEISRPEGIELNYFQNELEITARQGSPVLDIILVSISPVFMLIGLGLFFGDGKMVGAYLSIASVFTLAYSIYKLINSKKNSIYITVNDDAIEVMYRPKNFVKDKSFQTSSIDQVFVKPDATMGGFAVHLVTNSIDGQKQNRLLGGIKSELKAKYIEQEIEKYLDIKNRKVIGELQ